MEESLPSKKRTILLTRNFPELVSPAIQISRDIRGNNPQLVAPMDLSTMGKLPVMLKKRAVMRSPVIGTTGKIQSTSSSKERPYKTLLESKERSRTPMAKRRKRRSQRRRRDQLLVTRLIRSLMMSAMMHSEQSKMKVRVALKTTWKRRKLVRKFQRQELVISIGAL